MLKRMVSHGYQAVRGGGMYFSEEPFDTTLYGVCRIDCTFGVGVPLYNGTLVKELIPDIGRWNLTKVTILGTYIPFTEKYTDKWHVSHSDLNLNNCSIGNQTIYNYKMFRIMFTRMFPTETRFGTTDPRVLAVDSIDRSIRKIFSAWGATTDVMQLAYAWVQNPTAPWKAVAPQATEDDWADFENRASAIFQLYDMHLGFGDCDSFRNGSHYENFRRWFTQVFVPGGMGLKFPIVDWGAVLRRTRTPETVLTVSDEYLAFLEANPFSIVTSKYAAPPLFTSANVFVPRYGVTIRGPSAYDPAEWKPLVAAGVIEQGSPLYAALQDGNACCQENKTQEIMKAAIDFLAYRFFWNSSRGGVRERDQRTLFSQLQWLVPFDPLVIPTWMANALLRSVGVSLLHCRGLGSSPLEISLIDEAVYFVRFSVAPLHSR